MTISIQEFLAGRTPSVEELLGKYGTSLEETRALMPELMDAIKGKQQTMDFPTQPLLYTSTEAANMGVTIEPDWMLKLTPVGDQFRVSFVTPQKWEITEDNEYISPTGDTYTSDEVKEMNRLATLSPEELATEQTKLTSEAWATQLGGTKYTPLQVQDIFGAVFPERDISDVVNYANTNAEGFLTDLRTIGWTDESESLLRMIAPNITNDEMFQIFGRFKEVEESGAKNAFDRLALGFINLAWQTWDFLSTTVPQAIAGFFRDPEIVSPIVLEGITPQKLIITDPATGLMKWAYSYGGGVVAPYEKV
jgi:hypothetical protein